MDSTHLNGLAVLPNSNSAAGVLDAIPCAVVVWNRDHAAMVVNRGAREMFGFEAGELEANPSLWMNHIHAEDRDLFSAAWNKLMAGEKKISCDYRFVRGEKEFWIRDVSVCRDGGAAAREGITSVYVDVSDLRREHRRERDEKRFEEVGDIIDTMVHGVKNDLQIISSGFDLMCLTTGTEASDYQSLFESIQRISRTILELREFFSPPEPKLSRASPKAILDELVRDTQAKLRRQNIDLRVRCQGAMPLLRLDWNEFRKVLGQVIEFAGFLLPAGGELELKIAVQEVDGKHQIALQVGCASATSLAVKETDIFRPFLKVNGRQAGLGIALARQILGRHNGDISFQKPDPRRGLFTISLQAH
ncbi:MAG TPA: PAS domain-containing protein [Candidatus Binatia bacterium]|jgi:nitrogen-specific signal transduction histidine kinase